MSAFTFVDRITELEPGAHGRGTFAVPQGLAEFRSSLVAEALGQLAAWVSMAHLDFALRPVAGLAGQLRFLRDVRPGELLELEVGIDSCDETAVAYHGVARIDATPVLELADCVGPMLPLADFDAPDAVRQRFGMLCEIGAPIGRFMGISGLAIEVGERGPGKIHAALRIPRDAAFFADHFPRKAVFPGTLLLDTQIRLVMELARETAAADQDLVARSVSNMKVRSFILPGQEVELRAEIGSEADEFLTVTQVARVDGRQIATARMTITARAA